MAEGREEDGGVEDHFRPLFMRNIFARLVRGFFAVGHLDVGQFAVRNFFSFG